MLTRRQEDVRLRPIYTVAEVARTLHIGEGTLRTWLRDRGGRSALIVPDGKGDYLSFYNLVEAHVLTSIRKNKVPLQRIGPALNYVKKEMSVERPLIHQKFQTDGVDLFVQMPGMLVNVSRQGQQAFRSIMEHYLKRIEWDPFGNPIRLYPFPPGDQDRKSRTVVVISPSIAFGRPVLTGTGVPLDELLSRNKAGDSVRDLVRAFGLPANAIEQALKFAA